MKQGHQAGVYCSGGEGWSDPGSILRVELQGSGGGGQGGYERRGIRVDARPKYLEAGYWDGEDQGRSRFVKGNRGLSLGLCKFEMLKVRLSGQLDANIWIPREDQRRDRYKLGITNI